MNLSNILSTNRDALLLAAVGALLHNLGKISSHFIQKQLKIGCPNYLYQNILQLIVPHLSSSLPNPWDTYNATYIAQSDILQPATKQALSTKLPRLPVPFDDRNYVIGDLIEYLGQGEPWYKPVNNSNTFGIESIFPKGSRFTHVMNRAHRGASGGEKEGIATAQQRAASRLWLSTPFGWEIPAPSCVATPCLGASGSVHPDIDKLKDNIESVIQQFLNQPQQPFPLHEFAAELRPLLAQAIADTQRPLNDITIWDIGYVGMVFFITQAVTLMLKAQPVSHDDLARQGQQNTLFWRVLAIRTNGLAYLQTTSIADLRVRQQLLKSALDRVQKELETSLIGFEVYRDEHGSFYIVPDLDSTNQAAILGQLQSLLEIDGVALSASWSDRLVNHPDDQGVYIGKYLNEQIRTIAPQSYNVATFERAWNQQPAADICTACAIRPQGYGADQIETYKHNTSYYRHKAASRNLCCICMARQSGVAEQWVKEGLSQHTVWIDEVADTNGRVALIVGSWQVDEFTMYTPGPQQPSDPSFALVDFLNSKPNNGYLFRSRSLTATWCDDIRCFKIDQIANTLGMFRVSRMQLLPSNHNPFNITLKDVSQSGDDFLLTVNEDLTSIGIGRSVQCFGVDFVVVDKNLLKTASMNARAKVTSTILWGNPPYLFKIRQNVKIPLTANPQSFARIRRVWEVTRHFWQEVLPTDAGRPINQSLIAGMLGRRANRLEIKGQLRCNQPNVSTPGDYHAYELVLERGVRMSVVWDPQNKRFITADNLEYLAKPEQLGQPVSQWLKNHRDKWLAIEEPSGYGYRRQVWGEIEIATVQEIPDSAYVPVIPIIAEPRTFMALAPADQALAMLGQIKSKYEREMGKVRNRLPLHLSIVYFSRRTPLRAALDAGQAMLQRRTSATAWTVQSVQVGALPANHQILASGTNQFNDTITIMLARDKQTVTWCIPAVMGDGVTPDNWYPYVIFEQDRDGNRVPVNRHRVFFDPNHNKVFIHAGDVQAGDQIQFAPSTFDFEFLDTTARRFDICYNPDGRRKMRFSRPFYLEDLDRLSELWRYLQQLLPSQRHQVVSTIETTRELWYGADGYEASLHDPVFHQFVADTLAGAEWRGDAWQHPDARDKLIQAGVRGELADLIELYMEIMKER